MPGSLSSRALVAVVVVTLVATAACSALTAPAPGSEAGRYAAVTSASAPVPLVTDSSADEFGVLLADTLALDGRGGAVRTFAFRRAHRTLRTDTIYRFRASIEYRVTRATLGAEPRIELGSFRPCPPNALCVPNDTGVVRAGRILLVRRARQGDVRLLYERG